jgi:hypothetical protein
VLLLVGASRLLRRWLHCSDARSRAVRQKRDAGHARGHV